MKLILQNITAESLCLARAQEMNFNTVGTFFNMLEKVANEDSPYTPGNISSIYHSGK
jgi:hypothetical protein